MSSEGGGAEAQAATSRGGANRKGDNGGGASYGPADGNPGHENHSGQVGGRYAKYVLVVLLIVYVFNFIDRQIISILAEDIKADLGISDADIGFLYGTAFAVFYAVFGIPLGKLADTWSRKSLISLGLGFWSLMTALSGTARSFAALATYRFGVGVGEASATPAAFSMLSDYFAPRVRATVLSIYSSGVYIGAGVGLFLGAAVVDAWEGRHPDAALAPFGLEGWQAAFLAVGLPGLLMAFWVWALREPERGLSEGLRIAPDPHPFRQTLGSLGAVLPPFTAFNVTRLGGVRALAVNALLAAAIALLSLAANLAFTNPVQWTALGLGLYAAASWMQGLKLREPETFAMMFRSRTFIFICIGFPCLSFVTYGAGFWSPPYLLRMHDVSLAEAGTMLGLGAAIGGWAGVTLGGVLADRLRPRLPTARLWLGVAAAVLSTPFAILFLLTDSVWVAYGCSFAFSMLSPLWVGGAASTVNDLMLPRMRATASAFYILMITFIGLALGPFMIGQFSDLFATAGLSDGLALQRAMMLGLGMFAAGVLFLFLAMRHLQADETARDAQAQALAEAAPE